MNLRQKWIILKKWLSQITCVSHSHFFRWGEATNLDVTVYMVPMLTFWLNKPNQRLAFPSSNLLFINYLKRSTASTVVFLFRMVSKYYFFIAGYHFGTRAEGLMFWTDWFLSWSKQMSHSWLVRVKFVHVNQSVVQGQDIFLVKVGKQVENQVSQNFLSSLWWSELC